MMSKSISDTLRRSIVEAVHCKEEVEGEFGASTQYLIDTLTEFESTEIGTTLETLAEEERLVIGRRYPPRENESFSFYVDLRLSADGQALITDIVSEALPIQRSLFED